MISQQRIDNALNRFHFYSLVNLENLTENERKIISEGTRKILVKRKDALYIQGSYPNGIYVLKKGMLKVFQANYDGSIQILFLYAPGETFGYRPILSNEYQPVSVAALEDCELDFLERNIFIDIQKKSHVLTNQLLVSLSHEFTVLTNRMNVFAQRGIKERLALALLILNEKFKTGQQLIAEIRLTRTDLANFVGTSLENLIRTINYFKEKNLIKVKGKSIYIENMQQLFILSAI